MFDRKYSVNTPPQQSLATRVLDGLASAEELPNSVVLLLCEGWLLIGKSGAVGLERHFVLIAGSSVAGPSSREAFRNADQIVGDEVEQKVTGDAANAAMLGFSQSTVLFAPTEDALDHRTT